MKKALLNTSQGEERTQDPETTTGEGTTYKPSIPTLGLICFLFHFLKYIFIFFCHEERESRTGGQSDETPGSRRLTTPITVISDEEGESQIKGMEIDQP